MEYNVYISAIALLSPLVYGCKVNPEPAEAMDSSHVLLPEPRYESTTSVEEALKGRRSIRDFSEEPLGIEEVSQLLWAGQGVTSEDGKRTVPSAGATYTIELYIIALNVEGFSKGIYHYNPSEHSLIRIREGDFREELLGATRNQPRFEKVPVSIIIAGNFERHKKKFGGVPEDLVKTWVYTEAGHASQSMYLQSESLGLGMVLMGGFDESKLNSLLELPSNETSLYLIPLGRKP